MLAGILSMAAGSQFTLRLRLGRLQPLSADFHSRSRSNGQAGVFASE